MCRVCIGSAKGLATAAAMALAAVTGSPSASALELTPLTIMLDAETPIGALQLSNDGVRPAAYQVTGLKWSQNHGQDAHTPASELIVTPPIVSLEPGESVIVRVGFVSPPSTAGGEGEYRLLLRDISQIEETGTPLKVRTQVLLPVFVSPDEISHAVNVRETSGSQGQKCLEVRNTGNVHKKLVSVGPRGKADAVSIQQYILAGETGTVCPRALEGELAGEALQVGLTSAYSNRVEFHDVSYPVATASPGASR